MSVYSHDIQPAACRHNFKISPNVMAAKFSHHTIYYNYGDGVRCVCVLQELETLRRNLLASLGQLQEELQSSVMTVHCCVAGALVLLHSLPAKLNPIIRPLMDCVKLESDAKLQVKDYIHVYIAVHLHVLSALIFDSVPSFVHMCTGYLKK